MILAGVVSGLVEALTDRAQLLESDVYMRSLACKMPDYLLGSRSDNTRHKYEGYFKKFREFMLRHSKSYLPCTPEHVALFIVHLLETKKSYSVITSFVYSIKWMHNLYNFKDPTDDVNVKDLLLCSKRTNVKSRGKKDIISPAQINSLFVKHEDSDDPSVVRDLAMIVIAYAGFLRYDELSSILCTDVTFKSDHVTIIITKSKTDQFRDGNEIVISRSDLVTCPCKALLRYINMIHTYFYFRPS